MLSTRKQKAKECWRNVRFRKYECYVEKLRTNEFENNSVEKDVELDSQSNEPHQSKELGTWPNSLVKDLHANLLSKRRQESWKSNIWN